MHYASKTPADAPPPASLFAVKNGEIHAYPTQKAGTAQPNAYLVTDADYKDYVISLEYKWGEKKFPPRLEHVRDAGLLYHVHRDTPGRLAGEFRGADPGRRHRRFVGGVLAGDRASSIRRRVSMRCRRTAACRSPWARTAISSARATAASNEYPGWNTLEVIVRGDRATHIVNGVVNMRVSDLKGWDAATNSWVKVDHGKIALQAESAEIFYRNIRIRPLTKADDMPPEPKLTEVWFPVPAKVTPGATPGARAVRCHRAVRRQEPRRLEERQGRRSRAAGRSTTARWWSGPAPATSRPRPRSATCSCTWSGAIRKLPADKVNQDRGNSGIFLQDVYEVQVLDNFENPTYVNGMVGSIYKQFPPLVNATWPAETWNTYDIIYTAPRFAADGSLTSPARLTVLLNGILVQNNSVLKGGTTYIGAPSYRPHGDMPLRLQDHRHLVRYRNIWLRKL